MIGFPPLTAGVGPGIGLPGGHDADQTKASHLRAQCFARACASELAMPTLSPL